jgi:hypothetical protein
MSRNWLIGLMWIMTSEAIFFCAGGIGDLVVAEATVATRRKRENC